MLKQIMLFVIIEGMSDLEYQKLDKRLKALEKKLTNTTTEVLDKKPRKSSDYNVFMRDYIAEQKTKGTTKSHKDLFAEGAKAWTQKKNLK